MEEKYFTTEQVANILQLHPFTILRFIKEGKLKGIKLGRVYRIKESDVKSFLEQSMTQPGKKATKKEPEKKKKEESKTYEIDKKDDQDKDEHYYII